MHRAPSYAEATDGKARSRKLTTYEKQKAPSWGVGGRNRHRAKGKKHRSNNL